MKGSLASLASSDLINILRSNASELALFNNGEILLIQRSHLNAVERE
jgi:hypothetical protein